MLIISTFYGIIIQMYWERPRAPHFHANYAEDEVLIDIRTLMVLKGKMSRRALALVLEWAQEHRDELWRIGNYVNAIYHQKRYRLFESSSYTNKGAMAGEVSRTA